MLTYNDIRRRLDDAPQHYRKLASQSTGLNQMMLERIALTADSLRENLKEKEDGSFGLDLKKAIRGAQQQIRSQQCGSEVGTPKNKVLTYIRDIEGYTQIKYIPTSRASRYPQCPLLR